MVRSRLKRGDRVRVIAGKHRGEEGTLLSVDREKNRVFVEGVNVIRKAQRPTQQNPSGGFREQEAPIHASNVQLLDPSSNEPTRVRMEVNEDGRKQRVSVKTGGSLDG
jgi:large subunit ribosomal protein L24